MATAGDLITAAFNKVSVYNPTAAQIATALLSLNSFVAANSPEGVGYVVTGETLALTIGTSTYTIGSGGDLDTVRPDRLDNCYLKNSDGYDFPVGVYSGKDYGRLTLKTSDGRPENVYFLPEYPLAKVLFDKEPDVAYTAYFDFWKPFTAFADTSASMSLPSEYEEFYIYNLAVRCGEDWDRKIPDTVLFRAKETKTIIEELRASNLPPPMIQFDAMLSARRYNIYNDE